MSQYLPKNTKTGDFKQQRTLYGTLFVIPERLASIRAVVLAFTANKQTNEQTNKRTLSIIYIDTYIYVTPCIGRFTPEEKAKRHPCAYLPFGHGPRNCIGMRFALFEMKMALITILQKYRIVLAPETEVRELTKNRCVVVSTCMLKRLVNVFSSLFEESMFCCEYLHVKMIGALFLISFHMTAFSLMS